MSRIHIDYAGPKDDYYYFIIIDAYSGWPEIFVLKIAPTSSTINALKRVFSQFGLPLAIVRDNATYAEVSVSRSQKIIHSL